MNTSSPTPLEQDLETLHKSPVPESAFATRLQSELRARAESLEAAPPPLRKVPWLPQLRMNGFHRTWSTAALTFVLILAATLTFIGPQRVWAEIQQFFRYVPGVGFVDLENARVLAAPVAIEREGITLIVTQVIAASDRTLIRFETQGLPPEDQIWPEGAEFDENFLAQLRLPDGTLFDSQGMMLGSGNGQIEFLPLPADTSLITLELNRLPLTPPGMFPENWAIPLPLRPVDGELDRALFPEPYTPENATDIHHDITAQVLQVVHAPEGTAIQVILFWENDPNWHSFSFAHLTDDLGHSYGEIQATGTSAFQTMVVSVQEILPETTFNTFDQTTLYSPLSLSARQLTLEISEVNANIPVEGSFTIDLGDNPEIGDTWELDIPIEIAGLTAKITSARITEETYDYQDYIEHTKNLEFIIQAEPAEDGHLIRSLGFINSEGWFSSGLMEYSPSGQSSIIKNSFGVNVDQPFPHGNLTFHFDEANITYPGPWVLTWPVPGGLTDPDQQPGPVIHQPADARDTHSNLTLSLSETIQTDRVFALTLHPENLPPGAVFLRPTTWGEDRANRSRITLADNLGNVQDSYNWNVSWGPFQNINLIQTHLNFTPPNPLATRLTLTVPAVQLFLPGETSFDVTLPPGMSVLTESIADPADLPPAGAWEVDIPIEIAGFQIHFTHAWLEERNDPISLVLFAEAIEGQMGDFYLSGLKTTSVLTPNGQTWIPEPYSIGIAYLIPGNGYMVMLEINAFDPQQFTVLPGTYHVNLAGVEVTLRGPWKLSWDLMGP